MRTTQAQVLLCAAAALVLGSTALADDAPEILLNRQWAETAFSMQVGSIPFSFIYGGQSSRSLVGTWSRSVSDEAISPTVRRRTLTISDPTTKLEVKAVANIYTDTAGVDWTLYFTNKGISDTRLIEQVRAVDAPVQVGSGALTVHRLNGGACGTDDWIPFDNTISEGGSLGFSASGGRSSNVCPFFNLDWGTGGVITAIGWSGQWTASIDRFSPGSARVAAGMQNMRLRLHPGESIRSPRIMQVYWTGSDQLRSYNLFRRTMFSHVLPRINGELVTPPIVHLSTSFYELNDSTEQNTLSHLEPIKGLGFEAFWLDAYWTKWGFPAGMGNYGFPITRAEPADRFPSGLRPIGDAAHAEGMKFVLWFEPERVAAGTVIALEHPEWVMSPAGDGSGLYNLGIPEARQYMTDYLATVIEAYGMDCLRIDYNIDPLGFWQYMDSLDSNRVGIAEIRYVEGLYKMWDDVRAARPHIFIDNCASGGRRVDLETCSRSIPLWRTDATIGPLFAHDFDQSSLQNQVMTAGLSRYMPFSTSGQMGVTPYQFRGGFNAGISFCEDVRPSDYPKQTLAQAIAEGKRIRRYYFGSFYPLSPVTISSSDWCVMQYHLPATDEGMVMAFRRQASSAGTYHCDVREIDTQANYDVKLSYSYEPGPTITIAGEQLAGLMIEIPDKPGSVIIEYKKSALTGRGVVSGFARATQPGGALAPVVGAVVRVLGAPIGATTGDDGAYSLSLAPGNYTLQCEKPGYTPQKTSVTIEDGGSVTHDFLFAVGVVKGEVTANAPGQPPIYRATAQSADGLASALTDSLGDYTLVLPTGPHTISASGSGYSPRLANVNVQTGAAVTCDLRLDVVTVESAAEQFTLTNAPGGVWTYGWQKPLGSAMTLYDQLSNPAGVSAIQMWNMQGDIGAGIAGLIWQNTSPEPSSQWGWTESGQMCVHPGPGDQKAVVRWTAQSAGHIGIGATFTGQNPGGTSTDVHVLRNGVSIFDGQVSGFAGRRQNAYSDRSGSSPTQSYEGEADVTPGDTIDFAVGFGGIDYSSDLTGLDAVIREPLAMGTLTGRVSSAVSGLPISGALVSVTTEGYEAVADATGLYRLALPEGVHHLVASAPGYDSQELDVSISAGAISTRNVALGRNRRWNAATDFRSDTNPNGQWSYGYWWPSDRSFVLYDSLERTSGIYPNVLAWVTGENVNNNGMVAKNVSGAPQFIWTSYQIEAAQLCVHTGPDGQNGVARWTAPYSGSFRVEAGFTGQSTMATSRDVHVRVNNQDVYSRLIQGFIGRASNNYTDGTGWPREQLYSAILALDQGDTLDFASGYGSDSYWGGDLTGLDARITAVLDASGLGAARSAADGTLVRLGSPVVVTAGSGTFAGCVYVEDANRASGIRVVPASGQPTVAVGSRVLIVGTMGTDVSGERVMLDARIDLVTP